MKKINLDFIEVKFGFLNLVRLLLLDNTEMKNIKFMFNKLLNVEIYSSLLVMVVVYKLIYLDEYKI